MRVEYRRKRRLKLVNDSVIFLEPIFQERIWGGKRLHEAFGFNLPNKRIGECWAISAHSHGDCLVKNGPYAGKTLSNVFDSHPDRFGNTADIVFPLLVKILDAEEDLSVQVHPDDTYANLHEHGSLGKRECWYVIDCKPDATIIIGQKARSAQEMQAAIDDQRLSELLVEVPIKPGDFFQIEPGCVHALKAGTLILETQQSSDVTYRLYDYDRTDDSGQKRELHIAQALDVIDYQLNGLNRGSLTSDPSVPGHFILEKNESYTVHLITCENEACNISMTAPYILGTALEGSGVVNGAPVVKGDSFIVLDSPSELSITGNLTLICSHI